MIARTAARFRLHGVSERHIRAGLAYCEGIDFDVYRYYLLGWRAKLQLARCSNWAHVRRPQSSPDGSTSAASVASRAARAGRRRTTPRT
jgi:hypothetical protein